MRRYLGISAALALGLALTGIGCSLLYPVPFSLDGAYAGDFRTVIGFDTPAMCTMKLSLRVDNAPRCGMLRQARMTGEARLDMDCMVEELLIPDRYKPLFQALDVNFGEEAHFELEGYLFADGLVRLKSIATPPEMDERGINFNLRRLHLIGEGVPRGVAMHQFQGGWLASVDFRIYDFTRVFNVIDGFDVDEAAEAARDALIALLNDYPQYLPPGVAEATRDTLRDVVQEMSETEFIFTVDTMVEYFDLEVLVESAGLSRFLAELILGIDFSEIPPPIFGHFELERSP